MRTETVDRRSETQPYRLQTIDYRFRRIPRTPTPPLSMVIVSIGCYGCLRPSLVYCELWTIRQWSIFSFFSIVYIVCCCCLLSLNFSI